MEVWCAWHIAAVLTDIIRDFSRCKASYRATLEEGNGTVQTKINRNYI